MKPFFISLGCFGFLALMFLSQAESLDAFLIVFALGFFISLLVQAFVSLVLRLNPFFSLRKSLIILAKDEFIIFYEKYGILYKINLNQRKIFKFEDEDWQEIQEFPNAFLLKKALKFIADFEGFAEQNTQNLLLNQSHNIFYTHFPKAFKELTHLHFDPFILKLKHKELAKTLLRAFVYMIIAPFTIPAFIFFLYKLSEFYNL